LGHEENQEEKRRQRMKELMDKRKEKQQVN
jgi:hypothetical protein